MGGGFSIFDFRLAIEDSGAAQEPGPPLPRPSPPSDGGEGAIQEMDASLAGPRFS